MRVSEHFNLGAEQPTLDFVDVDVVNDLCVFIDPRALRLLHTAWGDECVSLIQNFFKTVLDAIHEGKDEKARRLLRTLREPNETHLGLSRGRSRGRALGPDSARDVWESLRRSEAVKSGLLEDLEDTILMVDRIRDDIVSDITTNVIRGPLIRYTQSMCEYYGILLTPGVNSGPLWDPGERQWYSEFTRLPVAMGRKLLLTPKVVVRIKMDYDADEYYRDYLLEYLREVELSANSELVQLLKNGKRRVTIKDLIEKYGRGKSVIVRETLKNPQLLEQYRKDKQQHIRPPLRHEDFAEEEHSPLPNWRELLRAVKDVPPGKPEAGTYEKQVEGLLTALFYPSLSNPQVQHEIHEGRKRIDITYSNVAVQGFFRWLSLHYPAAHIFVECKNYRGEVGNPELDQLSGRFSPSRGQVGLLVCRSFEDKALFLRRCKDTTRDHRGFILALDDEDLEELISEREEEFDIQSFSLLRKRFEDLVM